MPKWKCFVNPPVIRCRGVNCPAQTSRTLAGVEHHRGAVKQWGT